MTLQNPLIKNSNICYDLGITISTPEENTSRIFEDSCVERVEIFNKLNEFYTTGLIQYVDTKQTIDKYIGKPIVYIQMAFT